MNSLGGLLALALSVWAITANAQPGGKSSAPLFACLHSYTSAPQIVAISDERVVSPGDTVVLTCVIFGQTTEDITWTLNGNSVGNSSLVTISQEDFIQVGRVFRQSFVQICTASDLDAGNYSCIARNGAVSATASTLLTMPGMPILASKQ